MAGIHLHPHDIVDEGTGQILRLIGDMGDIEYIFPEVNTIFERNPYPKGRLPHNPVHEYVQGLGTLHVQVDAAAVYPNLYQQIDISILSGEDPLAELKEATDGSRYRVIPWVNLLNGDFRGNTANNNVIDFRGRTVDHWLCPNGPDVIPMWSKILLAITERYGYTTYLIDRIRFPDWAGKEVRPQGIFSCFCPHCRSKMQSKGIDPLQLINEMKTITSRLKEQSFESAVTSMIQSETIKRWIVFRQDSVSSFVERLLAEVKKGNPQIRLWLDLWPPSYSWLLGQDYNRLTKVSDTLKHFPYHKLGGGADVQGFIEYFAQTPEKQEEAFQAFLKFFGLNYELSYESFKRKGYPLEFIKNENDKVRELSQPGTKIFSGIQMWNIGPEDLFEAIVAARASAADDVLYYCYGWAETELFRAVGEWNRLRGKSK